MLELINGPIPAVLLTGAFISVIRFVKSKYNGKNAWGQQGKNCRDQK